MGTDQALKEYPEIFRKYFGTVVPAGGQQVLGAQRGGLVGRLVRVRPQGRRGAAAAAGLLPHQRREHRPVRADADRRRRGRQGPLHRGLHGARSTPPTRSTSRSSRSSRCRAPRSATRPSRTGPTTSTTSSPSAPTPTRTRRSSGSTPTPARARRSSSRPSTCAARAPRPTSSASRSPARASTRTRAPRRSTSPRTRARGSSRSPSRKDGGRATYRGHLKVSPGATNVVASVRCDALMLDDISRSDTYPYIDIQEDDTTMTHEATVARSARTRSST